ncbi:uncharacterized protein LOC117336178 isoform X2 [Pecten maximus]|uniref:uncharacterized protein LOC117336178 isoform X2 n=1 Tax=Pecten maximus TaxID=6579 RepID=UPI00145801AA|nr:uncharacterized protein LOC117336178 isoform X2 [Pecten maximus]
MATVQTTIIQKSRFEDFRMSETRANHGYLETDIDEFLDQTPPEAQSLFNAGSKLSFQHDRDNGTNGISKSIVLTENSDTKPGPEDISADTPLVDSDKDEPLTSSASPFLQDNPRTESYVSDGNSEVLTNTPSFPKWKQIAVVVFFHPSVGFHVRKREVFKSNLFL